MERLDTHDTWRLSLARDLGTEADDPAEIRKLAVMYARAAGSVVVDVRFTQAGFTDYLASLVEG